MWYTPSRRDTATSVVQFSYFKLILVISPLGFVLGPESILLTFGHRHLVYLDLLKSLFGSFSHSGTNDLLLSSKVMKTPCDSCRIFNFLEGNS